MRRKALLPLLLLWVALSSCGLIQRGTEERLVFLNLPPDPLPSAQGVWVGGFSLPKGTYRVEVWAESSSHAPLWLGVATALPDECQGEGTTGYVYCPSPPSPIASIRPNGSWVEITDRVRGDEGGAPFFFLGIGWPSGTVWNGSVEIRLRYEAF